MVLRNLQYLIAFWVQLNLYTNYGPYVLYWVSVPAEYRCISTPAKVLKDFRDRKCQCRTSISLPPIVPYKFYRASVPVQHIYMFNSSLGRAVPTEKEYMYNTHKTLLHYGPCGLYWASMPVKYNYNSTPAMGPTELQNIRAFKVQLNL